MMMTLIMSLMTLMSFGQEKYSTYFHLANASAYNVLISYPDYDDGYLLWVEMMPINKRSEIGGVIIPEDGHSLFISAFNEAKLKYTEWVNTAKENNVTDLRKSMSYKAVVGGFFKYGGTWNFQAVVNLTFEFAIVNNIYLLIARTGNLTSSSNQFVTHDGFWFMFENEEEINDFLNILSPEKVVEFTNNRSKSNDLFKE